MAKRLLLGLLYIWALIPSKSIAQATNPELLMQQLDTSLVQWQERANEYIAAIKTEVRKAPISANTRFFIELAIRQLKSTGSTKLEKAFASIEKKRPLTGLDKEKILELEKLFLFQQVKISSYKKIKELPYAEHSNLTLELDFYQLTRFKQIGELGAGDAYFASFVATQTQNLLQYHINEVDPLAIELIQEQILLLGKKKSIFHSYLGTNTSTGMERLALDAILIRNAIHHFSDLDAMLLSIKASLREDGILLLKEAFKEECEHNCCPDLTSKAFLIQALRRHGFVLKNTATLLEEGNKWNLMAFEQEDI